jgi:4-diphosphocytidyl-2-C-methyl-D-erythritol kinase
MSELWPAPAKLNLFLHVVGRRADGYHLLQTLFRLIDRGDTLRLAPRTDGRIVRANSIAGVAEEDDLTVRAACLLQQEAGCHTGAEITLEKVLPLGGGLGGGSSDAATVLLALNRLWKIGFPRQRLQEIGLSLGADVPFFVFGRNAFAEGVGEALQSVVLAPAWYVVLEPAAHVSTQAIFAAPDLTRNTKAIKMSDFSAAWGTQSWKGKAPGEVSAPRAAFGHNDLEPVVCRRHPEVARAIEWLGRFGDARMTGSGCCVFAPFATEREAQDVLGRIPAGLQGWVARGIDEHPLRALAD